MAWCRLGRGRRFACWDKEQSAVCAFDRFIPIAVNAGCECLQNPWPIPNRLRFDEDVIDFIRWNVTATDI